MRSRPRSRSSNARRRSLGSVRYQIEAMVAALHCEAESWAATDWPRLLALYELLTQIDSSPVVPLSRAIALRFVQGPAAGLAEVEKLTGPLQHYHLFHATRDAFLRDLGRDREAARADTQALALTKNSGERALLQNRLALTATNGAIRSAQRRSVLGAHSRSAGTNSSDRSEP